MKKLLLIAILISGFFYSQTPTEFSLTKENGLTDFVVTETPNRTKEEIYKKTIDWINRTFQRADVAIQGQIENEYVRFQNYDNVTLCKNPNNNLIFTCQKIRYQIEVSVKDGKYKFDLINLERPNVMYPQFSIEPWDALPFDFNRKGELRNKILKEIPIEFNRLNNSLQEYILNGSESSIKDDW